MPSGFSVTRVVVFGSLFSALAYGVWKIQDWTKDGKVRGRLFTLVLRFLPAVTAFMGMLLFALIAVAVDAVVLAGAWDGRAWIGSPDPRTFAALAFVISSLALITGRSESFINLPSWYSDTQVEADARANPDFPQQTTGD